MKTWTRAGMALALAGALGGCAGPNANEQTGLIVGAIVGGVVGSHVGRGSGQDIATFVGAVTGAIVGGSIGRSMDDSDQMRTTLVLQNVRTGVPARWTNPRTQIVYTMVPTKTYETPTGLCREYTMDAMIGGRPEKVWGNACLQPDGSWKVVN